MSKRSTALVLLAAMAVAGCGGVKVNSDWNRSIDFSGFQTFGLMAPGETDGSGEASDSITDQRIKAAITADLEGKGLRKVDNNADIMVGYQITNKEDTSYQIVGTPQGLSNYRCRSRASAGCPARSCTQSQSAFGIPCDDVLRTSDDSRSN